MLPHVLSWVLLPSRVYLWIELVYLRHAFVHFHTAFLVSIEFTSYWDRISEFGCHSSNIGSSCRLDLPFLPYYNRPFSFIEIYSRSQSGRSIRNRLNQASAWIIGKKTTSGFEVFRMQSMHRNPTNRDWRKRSSQRLNRMQATLLGLWPISLHWIVALRSYLSRKSPAFVQSRCRLFPVGLIPLVEVYLRTCVRVAGHCQAGRQTGALALSGVAHLQATVGHFLQSSPV